MGKRIADAVHGTIPLTDLEVKVIDTRAFQRLRNIKHLGMASYVFPGADFSRFSHSIGVCHVIGQMYDALENNGAAISDRSRVHYRLAGLLHDIGHYPYSHSLERPIGNHYKKAGKPGEGQLYLDHEALGEKVVLNDPELAEVWKEVDLDPAIITRLFTRAEPDDPLANLISSDIDADRLDYLPRTAIHTGLPYGNVDTEYLLSQLYLGEDGILWVDKRALRTVEHALLARYFDNQQIAFHKTVAGFELVLENLTVTLLEQGLLQCSAEDMLSSIRNGAWYNFDDAALIRLIQELKRGTDQDAVRAKADTVLLRKPPKLIAEVSIMEERRSNTSRDKIKILRNVLSNVLAEYGISEDLILVWQPKIRTLTKAPASIPVSSLFSKGNWGDEADNLKQAVYIGGNNMVPEPIFEVADSLIAQLANKALFSYRVYMVPTQELIRNTEEIKQAIARGIAN